MYVANTMVPVEDNRDDVTVVVTDTLSEDPAKTIPLVVGARGMGKTAVLSSGVRRAAERLSATLVFIPGGMIASLGHFASLLARAVPISNASRGYPSPDILAILTEGALLGPIILAIDDLDTLLYKRNSIAVALGQAVTRTRLRLAGSVGADTLDRIVGRDRPLSQLPGVSILPLELALMSQRDARRLAVRRNPKLAPRMVDRIVDLAGGHPAAVVFLSRLLSATTTRLSSEQELDAVLDTAAGLAGSVYSGPWAALGPQQRAIIAALTAFGAPVGPADLADALLLPSSHVSSQLTRLRKEGLVRQTGRGCFGVAPLLSQWLEREVGSSSWQLRSILASGGSR